MEFLQKYKELFDGILGKYTGSDYIIELMEGAKPYHAKSFPISTINEPTLRKEIIFGLIKIGELSKKRSMDKSK